MNTNPKTLHCPNPRTSCSLHGSLGQTLLVQAYKKKQPKGTGHIYRDNCAGEKPHKV